MSTSRIFLLEFSRPLLVRFSGSDVVLRLRSVRRSENHADDLLRHSAVVSNLNADRHRRLARTFPCGQSPASNGSDHLSANAYGAYALALRRSLSRQLAQF